jgi:N-acetyl-anhydromuramyl-L-alanine amidase AmpD
MAHKLIDIRDKLPRHKTRRWKKRKSTEYIVVHTTASDNQDPFKTARYHIHTGKTNHISKKGCPGLVYHDFITKSGIVYHCNDYQDWTWHAGLYNRKSVGVTLAYKGQTPGRYPTEKQRTALSEHLLRLCLYLKVLPKRIVGHREVPGMFTILGGGSRKYKKTCPGMSINLDDLRMDVTCRLQRRLAAEQLYFGAIDGLFGPKSRVALEMFNPLKYHVS